MDAAKGKEVMDMLVAFATTYGLRVIGAVITLIVGRILAGWARRAARKGLERANVDPGIVTFVGSLVYYLVLIFAVLSALKKFGVETASLMAVLGAAGFAVGFALQGSLSNFAAGVMLLLFRPFRVGDVIDAAGVLGKVVELRMFTTVLLTPDNIRVIVPNSKIFGDTIRNITAEPVRRVDMTVGIGYGSSIEKAMAVIGDLLKSDPRVLDDPAPQVAVGELADSSVNILVRPWCKTEDYWGVLLDFQKNVKEAFDREGVEIPFPQLVVHKPDAA